MDRSYMAMDLKTMLFKLRDGSVKHLMQRRYLPSIQSHEFKLKRNLTHINLSKYEVYARKQTRGPCMACISAPHAEQHQRSIHLLSATGSLVGEMQEGEILWWGNCMSRTCFRKSKESLR